MQLLPIYVTVGTFLSPLSPLACVSRITLRAAGLLSLTCKGHCGVDSEVTDQYNIHLLVSCKQVHEGQFTPGLCLTNMSRDHPMQIMLTAACAMLISLHIVH